MLLALNMFVKRCVNCFASIRPMKWTELSLIGIVNSAGLMSINLNVPERDRRAKEESESEKIA